MSKSKFYVNIAEYYVLECLEEYRVAKKVSSEKVVHFVSDFQSRCVVLQEILRGEKPFCIEQD